MATDGRASDPRVSDPRDSDPRASDPLDDVRRIHQDLAERVAEGSWESVGAVLSLGAAVLLHGALERLAILPGHPLLDPAVVRDLEDEHDRLADDLRTLGELWRTSPSSPDVPPLADALYRHLGEHLQRDARLLYGSLARLQHLRPSGTAGPRLGASMTVVIGDGAERG
jgi:hypothetical protein